MRPPRLRLRAHGVLVAAFATVLATLLVLPAAPASADTRLLCRGFSQCASLGYGNANYSRYYQQMWWRMYAGHNCTNYASYRMVRAGMSSTRPWSGGGNASNWGIALADRTDQTPMVRSIAWWRDRNHVQVVERVISRDRIIVSEDHWGGDFDWAEIRRGDGSNWPDGFIHLRDAQVQNLRLPEVLGTPKVGAELTMDAGAWRPWGRRDVQWLRNGRPITGATATTFTPRPRDVGAQLSVRVVAHRYGYLDKTATSTRTAPVVSGTFTVAQPVSIEGFAKVTGTLTASPAVFDPAPGSTALQWFADGTPISGATGPTLELGSALLDKRITVSETAARYGWVSMVSSAAPTEPVGPEKIVAVRTPRVFGSPVLGETLRLDPGAINVTGAERTIHWRRNGVPFTNSSLYYSPTVDDLGDRISASVTYSKGGYSPVTWTATTAHVVQSRPWITFRSPSPRRVVVRVRAEGVSPVRRYVTLTDGSHATTLKLVDGRAVFGSWWITGGKHRFTALYRGSWLVTSGQRSLWVDVMRPG